MRVRRKWVIVGVVALAAAISAALIGPRAYRKLRARLGRGAPAGAPAAAFRRPRPLALPPAPRLSSGALAVWVAPEGAKVMPDGTLARAPDGGAAAFARSFSDYRNQSPLWSADERLARASALRGETVALQIIVEARGAGLTGVDVEVGAFAGELGRTLPPAVADLAVAHHLRVMASSFADGRIMPGSAGPGDYPDPLVPAAAPRGGLPMTITRVGPVGADPRNRGAGLLRVAAGAPLPGPGPAQPARLELTIVTAGSLGEAAFRARENDGPPGPPVTTDLTSRVGEVTLEWLRPERGAYAAGDRFEVVRYPAFSQPIWLDLEVPADAAPGRYRAPVEVRADGVAPLAFTLELVVHPGVLGPPQLLAVARVYRQDLLIAEGRPQAYAEEATWPVELATYRLLREHGIEAVFREAMIEVGEAGVAPAEWERFDRTWGTVLDGSAFTDRRPIRVFEVPVPPLDLPADTPPNVVAAVRAQITRTVRAWTDHLAARGWLGAAFAYPIDEPAVEAYDGVMATAQLIAEASGGRLPLLLTEQPFPLDPVDDWISAADEKKYGPDLWTRGVPVAIWAVNARLAFPAADPANAATRLAIDRVHDKDARWWFYQLGEPFVGNTLIDDDALAFTTWGWIAWRYHPDGVFYYAACHWEQASFEFANPAGILHNPATYRGDAMVLHGDGTLLYPGAPFGLSGPIASLRMKALRRGLVDHALLAALAGQRGLAAADAEAARLVPQALNRFAPGTPAAVPSWKQPLGPGSWSRNAWDYEQTRQTIRAALPAPPPPPPPGKPAKPAKPAKPVKPVRPSKPKPPAG